MRALVSLSDNCGTNPVWSDWTWSTDTTDTSFLSVYFYMDPDFFPFVLHCILLTVTKKYDAQRATSSFKYRNSDCRTPIFASINMNLGCIWDNFSCHDLNSCCNYDRTSGNMIYWNLSHSLAKSRKIPTSIFNIKFWIFFLSELLSFCTSPNS